MRKCVSLPVEEKKKRCVKTWFFFKTPLNTYKKMYENVGSTHEKNSPMKKNVFNGHETFHFQEWLMIEIFYFIFKAENYFSWMKTFFFQEWKLWKRSTRKKKKKSPLAPVMLLKNETKQKHAWSSLLQGRILPLSVILCLSPRSTALKNCVYPW